MASYKLILSQTSFGAFTVEVDLDVKPAQCVVRREKDALPVSHFALLSANGDGAPPPEVSAAVINLCMQKLATQAVEYYTKRIEESKIETVDAPRTEIM